MRIGEGFSVGFAAIHANKMRSLLTMLGIVIGIASVLAMIAIGEWSQIDCAPGCPKDWRCQSGHVVPE